MTNRYDTNDTRTLLEAIEPTSDLMFLARACAKHIRITDAVSKSLMLRAQILLVERMEGVILGWREGDDLGPEMNSACEMIDSCFGPVGRALIRTSSIKALRELRWGA